MNWYVYVALCHDGSLYTGMTTDLARREQEHNSSNILGAKSLRSKRPVHIVYHEAYNTQTEARKREAEIKGWKRKYKLKLIDKL
ncbi:GIY-YIG nuclease family protein [Candidatus Gottesmanbacteria bacterium]|nr:GIY-YIG nuclease family protein [Candidatus Gottesmanbacteria bacterium]